MIRFNLTVDGRYSAELSLEADAQGPFSGTVAAGQYGTAPITEGVRTGDRLSGKVELRGVHAHVDATLMGDRIVGNLHGWFFNLPFVGNREG